METGKTRHLALFASTRRFGAEMLSDL